MMKSLSKSTSPNLQFNRKLLSNRVMFMFKVELLLAKFCYDTSQIFAIDLC
jgi:hypothetical protein